MKNIDRTELWHELASANFYINFLNLYIRKKERFNKILETILQAVSFISAVGLFKYVEGYWVIACLLLLISFIRLFKHHWVTADQTIGNFKSELEFYIEKSRTLEKLWRELESKTTDEKIAAAELEKYLAAEALLIKTVKHNKIEDNKLKIRAEDESIKYLSKKFSA